MHLKSAIVGIAGGVLLLTGGLTVVAAPASAAPTFSTPCFTSPNIQVAGSYTVPATGVSEVRAVLRGQNGAAGSNFGTGTNATGRPQDARTVGGKGSTMVVELAVTPGQVLTVGSLSGGSAGGLEGGGGVVRNDYGTYEGYRGGNGGDAQYLSTAGSDGCQHALAVAAGGGGASGKLAAGGNADAGSGATAGENGGGNYAVDGGGGGGATATMGGTPGAKGHDPGFCHDGETGFWGEFLKGGHGGNASVRVLTITSCLFPAHSAGGGGAGYYFGGGGGSAYAAGNATDGAQYSPGAGGGGSSFMDPSVRKISLTAGATAGVPIAAPVYDTATTIKSTPNPSYAGGAVTVTTRTTVAGTDTPVVLGTVRISSGGTLLATVPVGTNGEATWTTSDLPAGDDTLSAAFLSSEDPSVAYRASATQGSITQVVHACAPAPTFLDQPADVSGTTGTTVVLTATVSVSSVYEGTPEMEWQTSADGGTTWTTPAGTASVQTAGVTAGTGRATLSFAVSGPPGLLKYRAIATTCGGTATSNAATLTVRGIAFDLSTLPVKTYGSAPFDIAGYASKSTVPVAFSSDTGVTCTVAGTMVTVLAAGTCTLTASEDGTSSYATAPTVQRSFSSAKKVLTVVAAASPLSQPYGTASAPTVSCTSSGFVGSDRFVSPPTGGVGSYSHDQLGNNIFRPITIGATTAQGSYASYCSGGKPGASYTIGTYEKGSFTITAPLPPPLKITANDKSYNYGTTPPALDATYSISTSSLTGALTCRAYAKSDTAYGSPLALSATTPAGSYAIHCSGQSSSSYTLSWVNGTLTVGRAPVTVTAGTPSSQAQGDTSAPSVTCSATGFLGSDGFLTDPTGAVYDGSGTSQVSIDADAGAGVYVTKCTGGDPGSNYTITEYAPGSFTIEDRTPPVVTAPANKTVEATGPGGAKAAFSPTANDAVDGATDVTCDPASGSTFALGATTVTCKSTDAAGNTGTDSFTVTVVDTTAPVVTAPADKTVEATGPGGAKAAFSPTANDAVDGATDVTCDPAPGSTFALGTTTVTCKSTDAAGNTGTDSFTVTVVDTTAPVVTAPADKTVEATGPGGAEAAFSPTANDAVDGPTDVTCDPAPGSTFALGATTVTCKSTDAAGNTGTDSFTVTVVDTTAPDTNLAKTQPTNPTNPTKQTGASFTFSGNDLVGVAGFECKLDAGTFASCTSPQRYSGLAEGSHTFQVRAGDAAGNIDQTPDSYTWVIDTTAPVVTVADVSLDAASPAGAAVLFTATATDTDPASPVVTCTRVSGSTFGIGTTVVSCSATDAAGNTGTASFTVTVKGAGAQLTDLQAKVQNLQLAPTTRKNLQSILQSAQTAAGKGDTSAACDKLTSFVSQVKALSGKKIATPTADGLLSDARRIMTVLGCS